MVDLRLQAGGEVGRDGPMPPPGLVWPNDESSVEDASPTQAKQATPLPHR